MEMIHGGFGPIEVSADETSAHFRIKLKHASIRQRLKDVAFFEALFKRMSDHM